MAVRPNYYEQGLPKPSHRGARIAGHGPVKVRTASSVTRPLAVTYQPGPRKGDLRTVVAEDVRQATVLLPTGSLDVLMAKLLHGTSCRHSWWADQLGADPSSDDFVIPAEAVVQTREITVAVKVTHKRSAK